MPVVKGGVWTNIEDEILKAAVSKYGLNQWARVSSLLARKTAKQCKARWTEWLDPGIRKIEWSREEDEKLLHLAKLMPTQWRTIAPIVGRTATQCLERYQKLLDEAEARENHELDLAGQEGAETQAPSADDVRRLRPGELDPDPESKPARPDTIDLDEDEKEMLSEARARLANTQGKKAKRKARERQLEESRRLAVLQKRRELKSAGINVKVTTRKKGQMDYNADVPFEKAPAPGFFDTQDEQAMNERQREMFDPRKQQLANKRKGDLPDEQGQDHKRRKNDSGPSVGAAAARAAQLQRMREAEQSSKRRALVLPSPQVSDHDLEDIVKMGLSGDRASALAGGGDSDATRGLVGSYPTSMMGATPIRTPRAAPGEDRIAHELRNARARTDTQSALLGGDNTVITEGSDANGHTGIAPPAHAIVTPNPLATPLRNGGASVTSATPLRTPRDSFRLNHDDASSALISQTPRDIRLREQATKSSLRRQLANLPRPQQMDFELEAMPEEQDETSHASGTGDVEDAAERDRRLAARAHADALAEFRRQTRVVRRGLPRPSRLDVTAMRTQAEALTDPIAREIATAAVGLMAGDVEKFGGGEVLHPPKAPLTSSQNPQPELGEEALHRAEMEVLLEMGDSASSREDFSRAFERAWRHAHADRTLPGLSGYGEDEVDEDQLVTEFFDSLEDRITRVSEAGYAREKKLAKVHGGYLERSKKLRAKIGEAGEALAKIRLDLEVGRAAGVAEEAGMVGRLERLRDEVAFVSRREREAQEIFREKREELEGLRVGMGTV